MPGLINRAMTPAQPLEPLGVAPDGSGEPTSTTGDGADEAAVRARALAALPAPSNSSATDPNAPVLPTGGDPGTGTPVSKNPTTPTTPGQSPTTPTTSGQPGGGVTLPAGIGGAGGFVGGSGGFSGSGGGAGGGTAWTPTTGIVDKVQGITPQSATATGYTSTDVGSSPTATTTGYGTTGYTAQQGTAAQAGENVSGAMDRILASDSPYLQAARTQAAEEANSRGLLNSSMAVGAGETAAIQSALPIAQGDVQAAQFNAQQQNVMTISNMEQANAASAFHAQAETQAAQFAAAATNAASQFNSAEAQQKSLFAAEQWNQAARYSADAKNAASQFNVAAYNQAMQRYVDAKNTALAAQNDAENLSRRDTATIAAQTNIAQIGASATVAAAGQHAAATIAAAQIGAAASRANVEAEIAGNLQGIGLQMSQRERESIRGLGATEFNTFQTGLQNLMTTQMEPDARQNAIHNYMATWAGTPYLPFQINMDQFPGATTTTTTTGP